MNLAVLYLSLLGIVSTSNPAEVVRISVQPSQLAWRELDVTEQLLVTGYHADGTTIDLTNAATYQSSHPDVATVLPQGLIHVRGTGRGTITVTYQSHQAVVEMDASQAATVPISFRRQVIPVLTKNACASGACHGSPSGKGGFRLSLLGFDPDADHEWITRAEFGRRIERIDSSKSLLLRKPVLQVPHEGGRQLQLDSRDYTLVARWIEQGAASEADASDNRVSRLEIVSGSDVLHAPASTQQLKVIAHFADGRTRDVTDLTVFTSNDDEVGTVTKTGWVEFKKAGEVAILARYLGKMQTKNLVHLVQVPGYTWSAPPEKNFIDRLAFAKLQQLRLPPSEVCTDSQFIRRVSLDVTGKLPTADRVKAFLADERPNKRALLIDELLDSMDYVHHWTLKWSDLLGCNRRFVGVKGAYIFHQWIMNQIAQNVPLDQFVRTILSAQGGNYFNPPAGFYRRVRTPEDHAESVGQLFLGIRIQCARCHNHPFEEWLQDDYYGLAAFFARIKYKDGKEVVHLYNKEEVVYQDRKGEMVHPRTRKPVPPTPLGGSAIADANEDRLAVLAQWITARDNPFFARMLVNRYWYHLFGRGIVEPVDDFRASNPPSHPELLNALTKDFVENGFDAKHLLRTILNSQLYQLSANPNEFNKGDVKYFSHVQPRLLTAEQLMDAVVQITGVPEKFPGVPLGTTAAELPDGEYQHPFLKAFGRPLKSIACECEREADSNLEQALRLIGGDFVNKRITSDQGYITRLIAAGADSNTICDEIYLAALSRRPNDSERSILAEQLAQASDQRRVLEDILWTVLNLDEFLFRH